jgi:small-conductance mechanosensitive channel
MNLQSSHPLWSELLTDLSSPDLIWQSAALLLCVLSGWALSRFVMPILVEHDLHVTAENETAEYLMRALSSLFATVFVALVIPLLEQWLHTAVLQIVLPLFFSLFVIRVVFFLLRRVFSYSGKVGKSILIVEKIFAFLVWIGVALHISGLLPALIAYLDSITIPIGRHQESLLDILQALLSAILTLVVALWGTSVVEQRLMQLESVHPSLRAVLARVARASLILVAVLVSLSLVGLDLTVLSVFGGALGVGIGLGLQRLVSNYVSGFVILLERSFSIGDLVVIDKYTGRIKDIKTRYTVLINSENVESVIPNEILIAGAVQNLSHTDLNLRLTTSFTVVHIVDVDVLIPQLEKVVATLDAVLPSPAPEAILAKIAENGLMIDVSFTIAAKDKNNKSLIMSNANRAIWRQLGEMGVALANTLPESVRSVSQVQS